MKRARSEHMQALVLSYLKKRNYADSETSFKLDFKFEENIRDMTTRLSEETDASTSNVASLSVFTIDEYFSAFKEFLNFCHNAVTEHPKLIDLLYPIFCHMYIDLVMSGRNADAGTFFQHFKGAITPTCEEDPPIEKLRSGNQAADVENFDEIQLFRSKQYTVNLDNESHSLLLRFLHSESCLVLLKVINIHIFINITEGKTLFDLFSNSASTEPLRRISENERNLKKKQQSVDAKPKVNLNGMEIAPAKEEPVMLSAPSLLSPSTPVSAPVDTAHPLVSEVDLKTLKSSMQKVHESKPSVGNICVHSFLDTASTGLSHAVISNKYDFISTGHEDSTVRLWEISSEKINRSSQTTRRKTNLKSTENSTIQDRTSNYVELSPDVSKVHLGCDLYETLKARLESDPPLKHRRILRAHSGTVGCSCFSHDDRFLLSCSEDTTVRLWDLSSCKNKAIYRGHVHPVWCMAMSNHSLYFATGSFDKTARLWTTERKYPLRTFAGHNSNVECVAFHNNSSYLATADKTIRLWDIASGKTVRLLLGHWAAVTCLAFSPNGKFLASSGEDGRIRMWDIASGSLVKEMRGHEGAVYSIDFSPDGSMLASGGSDSCLRVWNTRTSQTPATKSNTDTNDPKLNPDFVGRWPLSEATIHAVKFESCNLLHCVTAEG